MRKSRVRPKEDDGDEGGDDWMLTYGDLMTQLVCFFVLLMSFSVVSSMKFREVIVSLQEALSGTGALPSWNSAIDEIPRTLEQELDEETLLELKTVFDKSISESNMSEHVETQIRDEGLVIILKQMQPSVFFDSADARIKEEAYPVLDQIGNIIKALPNDIRVGGHTDSRPIHTDQFPSNWELSTMRATNVLRYLSADIGIDPRRLSAAGYGAYRPIAPNDTEVGMSRNRRVEIIILRSERIDNKKSQESDPQDYSWNRENSLPNLQRYHIII